MISRRWILQSQSGQGYVEVVAVLPLILLFLAGILFFGRVLYVRLALEESAMSGARAAVETLDPSRGIEQGLIAARETLRSYGLRDARVSVSPLAPWTYGALLRVRADFRLYVADIPLIGLFYRDRSISLSEESYLRVEEYKSRWTR